MQPPPPPLPCHVNMTDWPTSSVHAFNHLRGFLSGCMQKRKPDEVCKFVLYEAATYATTYILINMASYMTNLQTSSGFRFCMQLWIQCLLPKIHYAFVAPSHFLGYSYFIIL